MDQPQRQEAAGGTPNSATEILRIEALDKSFGTLLALKQIDLSVRSGEVLFIIGPSGSGKSTLLRCINRLEEPTRGRITNDGTTITGHSVNLNRVRQDIGFVFQAFNLYPHMTALGNVTLALRMVKKMRKAEASARGRAVLDDVGLSDKYRSYPPELSGGQQQRVAIARALALEPKIMLFDEPDFCARSRACRRGVERHSRHARPWHDNAGGQSRNAFRQGGGGPGDFHERRRGR